MASELDSPSAEVQQVSLSWVPFLFFTRFGHLRLLWLVVL